MAKILVVDDSDALRATVEDVLVEAGHEVVLGADGHEGLSLAIETKGLDLIITDFNMPGLDGITMCHAIRDRLPGHTIPIVMLTTEGLQAVKEMGKAVGVVAWVMKPYENEKFISIITKILQREKNKAAS